MELDRGILLSQVKDGESEPCIGGLCHAGQELREASVDYNTSQDQTAYERALSAPHIGCPFRHTSREIYEGGGR